MTSPGRVARDVGGLSVAEAIRQAIVLHRAGRLAEAEHLYRAVLGAVPEQFDALHLLGVIASQRGHADEAARLIGRAVALYPASAEAQSNLANVLNTLRRHDEALAASNRALAGKPHDPDAHNNRGLALRGLARHAEALGSFERVLAINPRHPEALSNRGLALQDLKRSEDALACFDALLAIKPDFADAWHNRGSALCSLDRFDDAVASWDRAVALKPDFAEAWSNRAAALRRVQRPRDALASVDRALALKPDFAEAWHNRAGTLRELGDHEGAVASYARALALNPDDTNALEMRGFTLHFLGRHEEARRDFERAASLDPNRAFAQSMLAHMGLYNCDWRDHDASQQRLTALVRAAQQGVEPFPFLVSSDSAQDQLRCAQTSVRLRFPPAATPVWSGERYGHARIRVAYLSADFHEHATAYLMAELFERHDRGRFEVTGVSWGPDTPSALRTRLVQGFEHFVDVRGQSDREVAQWLRAQEIDLAVDLKGYTYDARPGILAQRPAPVQVNYLGYPGTLGSPYHDYLVADAVVIPEGAQGEYSEQVVRLPDSYQVNDRQRGIAARTPPRGELGLPQRGFVFCSFNSSYKITPAVFAVWMKLLRQVEGSVLWLLEGNAAAPGNLRREAQARGVDPSRLVFAPRRPLAEHLARQRVADLFLDTLPCNAHTTASDALWAGLPLLTCRGGTFAGRVAASLLTAVGMPELITATLAEYEALALRLAGDAAQLAALKAKLAANRATCALFDSARFTRHLEAAYATMWERAQRGEPPAAFAVAPLA